MTNFDLTELLQRMYGWHIRSERDVLEAYICSEGYLTVGRGHNCDAWPVPGVSRPGDRISQEQLESLYRDDAALAVADLDKRLPWWRGLGTVRAAVLFDMRYNMGLGSAPRNGRPGRGLLSFARALAHMQAGEWSRAAYEMLNSRWAAQVGPRARAMAAQMETGLWQV